MDELNFHDLFTIFKRRRKLFLFTTLAIAAVAVFIALRWSHYKAVATIEIQQPSISQSVTNISSNEPASSAAGLADRRISQIAQKVNSPESLSAIIAKLNLYPGINQKLPAEKLADIMRRHIQLNFVSTTVANPAAMQKESVEQLSAIAFTLSFNYTDAELTKQALDALVEQFIAEEANQRLQQSQQTSEFLDAELKTLEDTITEQEQKIAQFRAKYGESGPTAVLFNQQASMSNTVNLQNIESLISTTTATVGALRGQLAATDPYLPMVDEGKTLNTPSMQLKNLQAQLALLMGRYGKEHPDVVKVRAQIAALKAQGVKTQSASLKRDADNPTYLQIAAQLSAAEAQLRALTTQRDNLRQQQTKYAQALAANPMIEEQMSRLTLDLDNAKERHRMLKDKKLSAEMKYKLESTATGTRLRVLQAATVPEHTSPRRLLLLLGGLMLALLGGTITVIVVELFGQGIRGATHLASIVGVAPLVTVPHITRKA